MAKLIKHTIVEGWITIRKTQRHTRESNSLNNSNNNDNRINKLKRTII